MSEKAFEKLDRKLVEYVRKQRVLEKRSEEYEALEEVFDRPTLEIIYDFMKRGVIDSLLGTISAGKEARVYVGITPDEEKVAVKIYLVHTAEFRRGRFKYIEGDPRFKRVRRDMRGLVYAWTTKEFRNMKRAWDAGVRIPKPIAARGNVLVMEFIGTDLTPAPKLKDLVEVERWHFDAVIENVKKLYQKAGLVHGDLSEYNVFVHGEEVVIFDLSQAVTLEHPLAEELLARDVINLIRFFERRGVSVPTFEEALAYVKGS